MKQHTLFYGLFVSGLLLLVASSTHAQVYNTSNGSLKIGVDETLQQKMTLVNTFLQAAGYTIVAYDAKFLKKGANAFSTNTCYAYRKYVLVAVAEAGVEDLDIYVCDNNGTFITKDVGLDDDGMAMSEFVMNRTSLMQFKVVNYDSYNATHNYQVAIFLAMK